MIFDCDGVLVDSEPIANRVFAARLGALGLSMSVGEVMQKFAGRTREECLVLAAGMLGRALPAGFAAEWDRALFDALRREIQPVDGVAELLRGLEQAFCVASNSTPERMRISLDACGLLPLFQGRMFNAAEVARPKPAPDLFLHAARSMGAVPAECVVVEDTATGVRAAVAAGMPVYGYAAGPQADAAALRKEGATVFRDMRALSGLLSRAESGSS